MTDCKQCLADHEARLSGVHNRLSKAEARVEGLTEAIIQHNNCGYPQKCDDCATIHKRTCWVLAALSTPAQPVEPQIGMAADLMALWNRECHPSLPKAKGIGSGRERACRARLKERPLDAWIEVIGRINASVFCRGENDRGWKASFDWLLRPGTAIRVLEGKYDDWKPVKTSRPIGRDYDAASDR